MRQNINLYRDDDVIAELEKQFEDMTIGEKPVEDLSSKSPMDEALDKGVAKVNG